MSGKSHLFILSEIIERKALMRLSFKRCRWLHDFKTFSSVLSLETLYIFLSIFNTLSYCKCSSKVRSTSDNNRFCVAICHRPQMNLSLKTSLTYAMKAQFVESFFNVAMYSATASVAD